MDLKELAERFLVNDEATPERLGDLIRKLLPNCVVHKSGAVEISRRNASGKDLVRIVLSARLVASKLDGASVSSEVTTKEIAQYTGLPKDQASARAKEIVDEGFADRTAKGSYKARLHKVEMFLRQLTEIVDSEKGE
jgi:hypothetical protein